MKYYSISSSLSRKVTGHYPQVKEIKYSCDVWDEPRFIEHVYFTPVLDFEPITANAVLYAKSKSTDLINVTGMGFTKKPLVSTKLKDILQQFRKTGMQFFKSPVNKNGIVNEDYWVLNFFEVNMNFIDYTKSKVYLTENTFDLVRPLDIFDYNAYINTKEVIDEQGSPAGILVDSINILPGVDEDFFVLTQVEGGAKYIASEKLKAFIEQQSCTGIEFMPLELKLTEWLQGGIRETVYGKV